MALFEKKSTNIATVWGLDCQLDETKENFDKQFYYSGIVMVLFVNVFLDRKTNICKLAVLLIFKSFIMAKVQFSGNIADMRGKLGGGVFSRNRGGSYIRTKVTPVNPQSLAQGLVRSRLTNLSQAWRGLTAQQRESWNAAVSNFTGTDIFGSIKTPSGINLYNKLNINLGNIGVAPISLPPAPVGVGYFDTLSIVADASSGTIAVTFTTIGESAGQTVVVEATANVSAGKNFVKSEYRVISTFAGDATSPQAVGTAYVAKFGAMTAGQKVFVRVKFVDNTTGVSGQYTSASAIVAA